MVLKTKSKWSIGPIKLLIINQTDWIKYKIRFNTINIKNGFKKAVNYINFVNIIF